MTRYEAERPQGAARNSREKPPWKPLDELINEIPADRIGRTSIDSSIVDRLQGRKRPATSFETPVVRAIHKASYGELSSDMETKGVRSMRDLFMLDETALKDLSTVSQRSVERGINGYFNQQLVPPHGHLLVASISPILFTREALPREREQDIIDLVETGLESLPSRNSDMLRVRFGLADGILRNLREVEEVLDQSSS